MTTQDTLSRQLHGQVYEYYNQVQKEDQVYVHATPGHYNNKEEGTFTFKGKREVSDNIHPIG